MALERQQHQNENAFKFPVLVSMQKSQFVRDASCIDEASKVLSSWAFDLFVEEVSRYRSYEVIPMNGVPAVRYQKNREGLPRLLNGRCNCTIRVSFLIQCRHKLCQSGGVFDEEKFDRRWIKSVESDNEAERTGTFAK